MTAPDGTIQAAIRALGPGPLTELALAEHVFPLFSRVLGRDEIYLANHSLGRPLDRTALDLQHMMDLWYEGMDGAWDQWLAQIDRFRADVARLIGFSDPKAVVPKPGAGQGLRAAIHACPNPRPRIIATRAEFDSIDFILKAMAERGRAEVRWAPTDDHGLVRARDVAEAIDDATDLVVVSAVVFSTGQLVRGLDEIVAAAHVRGAKVVLDAYHAAGVVPLNAETLGADFVIGGSYKYTRGGPGAGWLAIHPGTLADSAWKTTDTGWFAKADVFAFGARDDAATYAPGGDGWLECTPVVATAYQAAAGLELVLGLGVERLREYSLQQQRALAGALTRNGVSLREHSPRGAFLLIPHDDAKGLCARLKHAGVNTDARITPDGQGCVRLCPDILNTSIELNRAASIVASCL